MNIVLIGYRGTGKTVVGELLAERLGMTYMGMDAQIVKKAGMPIPEIVEKSGWPGFRDMESEVARELAGLDHLIIDTGGGVIERPENQRPHILVKSVRRCHRLANSGRHPAAGPDRRKNVHRRNRRGPGATHAQIPKRRSPRN